MGGAVQPDRGHALNPRVAAHSILSEADRGTFADRAAESILPEVAPRDRGLALEIAYGCLRLRGRLDTRILALTDRPRNRIEASVLNWLRVGMYELTELRTPAHAAVNETVRQARRMSDTRTAGFINAVLRAASADPPDPFPSRDVDPLAYLTSYGSHPKWLVERWLDRLSAHDVKALVTHGNSRPPVVLRKLGVGDPTAALPEGVELRPLKMWPESYEVVRGSPAEVLASVPGVIQDPGASAVVDYLGDGISGPVYDACAAPGTKTMGLAGNSAGAVLAADVSFRRLGRVRASAARLGADVLHVVADARWPAVASVRTVLADVPCTGTGVLRRRPDARWRIGEEKLRSLVTLQGEILDACAGIVEEGGLLVYSTCSIEPEENEGQVERFLRRHPGFVRESLETSPVPEGCLTPQGDLFVRPWTTGTDGAFAARLRRAG